MGNYAVKRIDDMDAMYAGYFKRARAELGVTAFGLSVIDLPAGADQYPEHDHSRDGQEEVYVALSGDGEMEIEGERHPLDAETMIRVGPGTNRKVRPGPDGLRMLVIGGNPGKVYEAPARSMLGAPDPLAQRA
jgi:mannose-6-phosphate isomerase-like protein (cupin superfamily)